MTSAYIVIGALFVGIIILFYIYANKLVTAKENKPLEVYFLIFMILITVTLYSVEFLGFKITSQYVTVQKFKEYKRETDIEIQRLSKELNFIKGQNIELKNILHKKDPAKNR